jgi:3-deoxy-D-manno-octulosonate 8-phosphate phosphatase (KDO 8-P phosphatase)
MVDEQRARALAAGVRLVAFDVDGVLTDGRLLLGDNGVEYKGFNTRDGLGIKLLLKAGVEVAIITGRHSDVVAQRMESLGVNHVYQGCSDKLPYFHQLLESLSLSAKQAAYVGDDIPDLQVMLAAGFAVAVADAHSLVRRRAHWVTPSAGGRGAAREVCEFVLEAQDKLEGLYRAYLH